jgi:hypothetical protein
VAAADALAMSNAQLTMLNDRWAVTKYPGRGKIGRKLFELMKEQDGKSNCGNR